MTKQEKIKEAYGELFYFFEDKINSEGWIKDRDFWGCWPDNMKIIQWETTDHDNDYYDKRRPKSLHGIENNNGWIKIESDNLILPIDGTEVHFYHSFINENGLQNEYHKGVFNAALGFTSYYDSEHYKIKEVSHYQPITQSKPPIY